MPATGTVVLQRRAARGGIRPDANTSGSGPHWHASLDAGVAPRQDRNHHQSRRAHRPIPTTSPTPKPTPTPSATPSGELIEGFGYDDILQVDADGLAVRTAPYTSMPQAIGYTAERGSGSGPVRLDEGDYVSVDLDPSSSATRPGTASGRWRTPSCTPAPSFGTPRTTG